MLTKQTMFISNDVYFGNDCVNVSLRIVRTIRLTLCPLSPTRSTKMLVLTLSPCSLNAPMSQKAAAQCDGIAV